MILFDNKIIAQVYVLDFLDIFVNRYFHKHITELTPEQTLEEFKKWLINRFSYVKHMTDFCFMEIENKKLASPEEFVDYIFSNRGFKDRVLSLIEFYKDEKLQER